MSNNYYIPISSFVFPELVSAEAISPTDRDISGLFLGRNSYPTKTTGTIPVNPASEVLIVYSKPVTWKYADGCLMDYPLVIKTSAALLDSEALQELTLPSLPQGITAWAYPKTIFFENIKNVKYLFRSNEEMLQQIRRISQYQEVKIYPFIKDLCESFENLKISPIELSADIGDEIRENVKRLGLVKPDKAKDIQTECRTGACLGYSIGRFNPQEASADSILGDIGNDDVRVSNKAKQMLDDAYKKLKEFVQFVSDNKENYYELNPITLKPRFLHRGRSVACDWETLDPVLRCFVDFIAAYPPEVWNWFGNENRFEFVRSLWNCGIKGVLNKEDNPLNFKQMKRDVFNICLHFKSPNSVPASLKDITDPILQALYAVLLCEGESGTLCEMLREVKAIDYSLALYGAFKGYTYFSRIFIPEPLKLIPVRKEPTITSRETGETNDVCGGRVGNREEKTLLLFDDSIFVDNKATKKVRKRGMTSPQGKYRIIPLTEVPKRLSEGWTEGKKKLRQS